MLKGTLKRILPIVGMNFEHAHEHSSEHRIIADSFISTLLYWSRFVRQLREDN